MLVRHFRAMNSDIELVGSSAHQLHRAQQWLAAYEERYSRFRVLSELSRLNAAAGRPFRVSAGLFQLVTLSLDLARRSSGLFDPTVLRNLQAAGYDRSFELVAESQGRPHASPAKANWSDVRLDASSRAVTLPEGTGIDLGGIGKGWAVDRLADMLSTPCMVNGGGDIFVRGRPPDAESWRVGVTDPFRPEQDLAVLKVTDAGVATSSSLKRSWRSSGLMQHHLIDPRTGRPSDSDAVQVTVVAASAMLADFHAKVALLHGVRGGLAYLDGERDVEGLIVSREGQEHRTRGLARYVLA
jgi:thiamine biosynthesis lipoprotein